MYTKGEWAVDGTHVRTAVNCGQKHVAMVGYYNLGPEHPSTIALTEHLANAALISAAPNLLEILKEIKDTIKDGTLDKFSDKIDKAIAKGLAKGLMNEK